MKKTISVEHTVTEVKVDGQRQLIQKDCTKTKASRRTLPLIPEFEVLLEKKKLDQKTYRDVCKSCYNNEFLAYVCVDEMGNLLKPGYISQNFQTVLKNNNLRKIRFHDLRHSCASTLLSKGISMKAIQEWLGHSDFGTTANIYSHYEYQQKVESAQALRELFTV